MTLAGAAAVIEVRDIVKNYHRLRPLRLRRLSVHPGERVSILGFDPAAAEMLVNLITAAHLPDSGEVRVFGRRTSDIADSAAWLSLLDRFGIVSERAVLLEGLSVSQNMAVPFTLEIEPPSEDVRMSVSKLAGEIGLSAGVLDTIAGAAAPPVRARVRLARALALGPDVLILEHASASLTGHDLQSFAEDIVRVAIERRLAVVSVGADQRFAAALGGRRLLWRPGSGDCVEEGSWRRRFR